MRLFHFVSSSWFNKHAFRCIVPLLIFVFAFTDVQAQPPSITALSATTVCQGDAVTITGSNFKDVTDVKIGNGAAGTFTFDDNSIWLTTGSAAAGKIIVVTAAGADTSSEVLTILPSPVPELTHVGNV